MENDQPTLVELWFKIEKLRRMMILAASIDGFQSEEVLAYKQELDELIMQFQLQNN